MEKRTTDWDLHLMFVENAEKEAKKIYDKTKGKEKYSPTDIDEKKLNTIISKLSYL